MNKARQIITVFEHATLHYGRTYDGVVFKESHFNALAKLNDLHESKYFTLIHKGIRFSQYVGVIQVNGLSIEILPKIDRTDDNTQLWQEVLIHMLRVTKRLKVNNVGNAYVAKQNMHFLDIYFEWFLSEVQLLIRQGLIKKYYNRTSNVRALKGKLEFAGHLQKNSVHKERFFTSHQVCNVNHLEHQILGLALSIVEQFSNGTYLYSKCKSVQLDFPEVQKLKPNTSIFSRLVYTRKNKAYKTALEIARIIILNFAPNISSGKENMLALLFDMNSLWEEYILIQLRRVIATKEIEVNGQESKDFWKGNSLRPDIVLRKGSKTYIVDTKWKRPSSNSASVGDLRQMYAYCRFWDAEKALLLYPGVTIDNRFNKYKTDDYFNGHDGIDEINHYCKMGFVSVIREDTGQLDESIGEKVLALLEIA